MNIETPHRKPTTPHKKADTERFSNPLERKFDDVISPFQDFIKDSTTASGILVICTILALVVVHTSWGDAYENLLHTSLGITFGGVSFQKSLLQWINEGLMALFFFMIGLEIKRELLGGELQDLRLTIPVIFASIGGMILPALIYFLINAETDAASGWGITMATDTAFAVGVLALLGKRVPQSLAAFLIALAIIDDIGAVLVIAIFYTDTIVREYLVLVVILLLGLMLLNLLGVRRSPPYLIGGGLIWLATIQSGIHATVAGILVAFTVPARPRHGPYWFLRRTRRLINEFENLELQKHHQELNSGNNKLTNDDQHAIVELVQDTASKATTPLQLWERSIENPVALLILPVFALANAGVLLSTHDFPAILTDPVTIGIVVGLVMGKLAGICGFCWLAVKTELGDLPQNMTFRHVVGIALLGGMGFTMSIFIAGLSFAGSHEQLQTAKASILLASLIAGISGYLWLRITSHKQSS